MSKKHSISALIFEAIGERAKTEAPLELYLDWSRDSAIAGAKHLTQKAELSNISKLFSENKIPFLILKGFFLKKLYRQPSLREMTDIDIFVGKENFELASKLLLSSGYHADLTLEVHDSFKKPPFIEVELHRILHHDAPDYKIDNTLTSAENPYCRIMTEEDFVVFLLHHAKKHDEAGGAGIRTVFDFYLLFKNKSFDGKRFISRIEKEKLLDFYKRLEMLIEFWFYNGKTNAELLDFEIYTVTGGTYGNLENAYLRKNRKKSKLGVLFERIFPSYKLMSSRYPVIKKCPILLPFFYPVRWIVSIFNGSVKRNAKALKGASKKKKELDKIDSK